MERELLKKEIESYVSEYVRFMSIECFPSYDLMFKQVSLADANSQGYEVLACASYKVETQTHTLHVSTNVELSKYFMFHEFTHILDSELYVNGDKVRYAGLSGYTEYHAAQVELAILLGATSIVEIPQFSMYSKVFTSAGRVSVMQYIQDKQAHAIELFNRSDFPANIAAMKTALGVLFNYWGLRSICEMYAIDFTEMQNNEAFLKFISTMHFSTLNRLMHGWLDRSKIDKSILLYIEIIKSIIQRYKLA